MEATDLMVGDLVRVTKDCCIKKGTIVRICAIDAEKELPELGLKGCAFCRPIDDNSIECGGVWLAYLEPIPLTPEILEKNGFSKSRLMGEQRHFTYYLAPSVSLLAIYDADFSLKIGDCARYIKYVHELQHALKICGVKKEIIL